MCFSLIMLCLTMTSSLIVSRVEVCIFFSVGYNLLGTYFFLYNSRESWLIIEKCLAKTGCYLISVKVILLFTSKLNILLNKSFISGVQFSIFFFLVLFAEISKSKFSANFLSWEHFFSMANTYLFWKEALSWAWSRKELRRPTCPPRNHKFNPLFPRRFLVTYTAKCPIQCCEHLLFFWRNRNLPVCTLSCHFMWSLTRFEALCLDVDIPFCGGPPGQL